MRTVIGRLARDQRVRFLAVGVTNTVVGYLVFSAFTLWVFADVYLGYLLSLALSYVVGITLAFVLYRRFVFPVHGHLLRDFCPVRKRLSGGNRHQCGLAAAAG